MFPKEQIAEVKMTSESDGVSYKQYDIGWKYTLRVYDDGKITYVDKSYHRPNSYGNLGQVFPNLVVEDMELKFRLEDFVEIIMERMEPGPYAKLLWSNNEEVKQEFIECMVDTYESGLKDEDRRKLLEGVKKEVHSKKLDELAYTMHKQEYEMSRKHSYHQKIDRLNNWFRNEGIMNKEGNPLRFETESEDERIGGTNWNEAREFWRKKVLEQFPKGE